MANLSFGRHQSFPLREGWMPKALNAWPEYGQKIFGKIEGIRILGIGSNMVNSLKYWLKAGNVIQITGSKISLTSFGQIILEKDPYCELRLTWLLFHYFLINNFEMAPVFYYVFNIIPTQPFSYFEKEKLASRAHTYFESQGYTASLAGVEKDCNVFFQTYLPPDSELIPEDTAYTPLSRLSLLRNIETDFDHSIYFQKPEIDRAFSFLVSYLLSLKYEKAFDIEEAFKTSGSVSHAFAISRHNFNQVLLDLEKEDLVSIENTAGLNTVYLKRKLSLPELYELWIEKGGH